MQFVDTTCLVTPIATYICLCFVNQPPIPPSDISVRFLFIACHSPKSPPVFERRTKPMLGSWPCIDPHNFSQFKPNDPSNPSKMTPVTYHPTHDRTLPPPNQVIAPEAKNILLRHFYKHAEEKLRPKRASCDNPTPERASKLPRSSSASDTFKLAYEP